MKTLFPFSMRSSIVAFVLALFAFSPLRGQVLENPPTFTFETGGILGFDAEVRDVIQITSGVHTGKLIVVGDFSDYRGTAVNRIVRLNADGTLDAGFTTLPGTFSAIVNSVKIDGMNRIVIGGDFNVMNYRRIARMDIDGNLDGTFVQNTNLTGTSGVRSIAIDPADNSIVAVGGFTTPRNRVLRFTNTGAVDATFSGNVGTGLNGVDPAQAVVIDNMSRIVIGGAFTDYNGSARGRLVRLNANGTIDNTFLNALAGANGPIFEVQIDAMNRILIGGDFTTFNGTARNRIARLTTTGALEAVGTFNPGTGANNTVNSIAFEPGTNRIVLGGGFTTYNGTGRANIARINANGSLDFSFNPGTGFTGGVVKVMIETPTPKLVVGGQFTAFNSMTDNRNRLARFFYASGATNNGRVFSERQQNNGGTDDILEIVLGPATPTAPLDVEEWTSTVANGTDFTLGTHYTIVGGPVPAGMTLAIQKVNSKTARIRITGNAAAHANINDVTNLRIVWQNAALLGSNAAGVENLNTDATTGANILYTIDFRDPATAAYTGPMFTETFINNGAVTGTRTVTLTNVMFRTSLATGATFTAGADFTAAGLPGGMGITVTKTGANTATFTLTGNAAAHAAVNSGNLILTWNDAAFEGMTMVGTNITGINGVMNTITFLDPGTAAYSGTVFPEAVPPNTGTITQTRTVTLTNDNFLNSIANGTVLTGGGTHYTLGGTAVPAGLTFRATKTSNTVVTLDFTGTAGAHANVNDVAGITVNFANAVLESGNAAGVTGLNPGNLSIDFQDPTPSVVFSGTTFNEDAPMNNGSVPTTRTITLSNDTWTMPDGPLTAGVHYNATNVPAGLTANVTKMGAVLTVSFTGMAAPHTIGANTTNTQLTFLNAAVTSNNAAGVTGLNGTNLSVTFVDAITMFTSAMPPNGSTSIAYTHTFTVDGSPASTFALQSGTLPPGLTLGAGGVLNGTPTMAGMFMFTVRATNGVGTGFFDQTYTVNITAGTPPTMFTSAAPPSGLPATAYTHTFVANGNPVPNSYTVVAGALPGGLMLNAATGALTGMPAANGVFNFTVRAGNGVGTHDQAYTINIGAGTTMVTSGPPPTGNLMTAYSHTFTGNGSPLANNFMVTAGALPPGLMLNAGTGALTGTPTALGTYNFTIQAGNGFGNATQAYSVQIDPQNVAPTLFTSPAAPATGTTGSPYSHTFAANGSPTPFYTLASGTLPPGLSLNPITGVLNGTPTGVGAFTFTVRALNIAGNTVSAPVTITVGNPPPPIVTPPAMGGGTGSGQQPAAPTAFALGQSPIQIGSSVGLPYALPVIANGNPAPTYSLIGGSLPPGITMSPDGVLSGTPTMEGEYTFTVRAANNLGGSNATFVMRVGPPRPVITALSQDNGSLGDRVVLTGYNFNGATEVLIGGVPATSFSIDNNNQITAVVGNGGTGPITVRTQHGTASSPTFTYRTPAVPEIRSISTPQVVTGPGNYPMVINGTNLSPFGGFSVEPADRPGFRLPVEVVSVSPTQATIMLPIASRMPGVNRLVFTVGNNVISTTFAVVPGPAPFITNVSVPSTVASAQPFMTMLTGGNYFPNNFASLTVNGRPTRGQVLNPGQALIEIPRDLNILGSDVQVRLTNFDGQFTQATVRVNSLPGPFIASVTPVWTGNSQQLVLRGNNYLPGARVRLQNREMQVLALSPTEITIQVPDNFPRPALTDESWVVDVENPDTQNYAFRVAPSLLIPPATQTSCSTCPAPVLPELIAASPAEVFTGQGDYTVTVTGRNIPPSASFRVEPVLGQGAYPAVVEAISPDRAILRLPAESRRLGPQRIVMNAGRGAASTGFTIVPGVRPLITSLSVPSTTANGRAFTTTVRGSGFYTNPPARITSDGRFLPSRIVSDSEALVEIPVDMNFPGPVIRLRLTNADEQYAETSLMIDAADPLSIQSVQPVRFTENTIEYLVRGRGFYPSSRVTIGGRDVRVRMVQPSEMVIEYPRNAPAPSRPGETTALQVRNTDGQCASYCMDAPLFTPPSGAGIGSIGNNIGKFGSESQSSLNGRGAAFGQSISGASGMEVFPNPADENITVQMLIDNTGVMRLSVKDMLGRTVLTLPEETVQSGLFSKNLSLGTLPQGVYLVEVQQDARRKVMKVVKQR